ncbi:hypothetical protein GCM10012275_55290 [Longimycelium tulufanense]|uniref:Uncharacterized protein n=1 Tax=Longimycelium tulufanense TaxID=907463 RepID=A0A8J3CKM1_9PSEU|nr:hypothetical protein GCM10012275_55290 [Longimycelium tulufanense]
MAVIQRQIGIIGGGDQQSDAGGVEPDRLEQHAGQQEQHMMSPAWAKLLTQTLPTLIHS